MTEKTHWPFGEGAQPSHAPKKDETHQIPRDEAARRQLRNDRLLVGGRAHVKKPGLS